MTSHPYLRAYLSGIAVPTALLPVLLAVIVGTHSGEGLPAGLERFLVFPIAAVPNLWGLWNVLLVAVRRSGRRWPIGVHGALLPFLLLPAGVLLARSLEVALYTPSRVAGAFPVVVIVYYVVWKHVVGFLNRVLGVEP